MNKASLAVTFEVVNSFFHLRDLYQSVGQIIILTTQQTTYFLVQFSWQVTLFTYPSQILLAFGTSKRSFWTLCVCLWERGDRGQDTACMCVCVCVQW